jgi:ADP-heptose:LPS heptosyltransferase
MSHEHSSPSSPGPHPHPDTIGRVAIVLPDMIGTTVCALPAVQAIAAAYASASLRLFGFARCAELLGDEPVAADLELLTPDTLGTQLIEALRTGPPTQLVFDFLSTPDSEGALAKAGVEHRVGWPCDTDDEGHTIAVPPPGERSQLANQDYLDFLVAVGQPASLTPPRLVADSSTCAAGHQWLSDQGATPGPLLVLGVGGGNELKRWPLANYRQVAADFEQREGGQTVFFLGPREAGMGAELHALHPAALIAESLPLDLAKGIIAGARLAVCNDHAIMHLAAALTVPTIGIFLSSDPVEWFPYEPPAVYVVGPPLECRPCYAAECEHWSCNHPDLLAEVRTHVDRLLSDT